MTRSWEGRSYADLVARFGPPDAVLSDGQGGRTVVYVEKKEWTTAGELTTTTIPIVTMSENGIVDQSVTYPQYTPPQRYGYTAVRTFSIDPRGRIYRATLRRR